jgi:hypothetical protein
MTQPLLASLLVFGMLAIMAAKAMPLIPAEVPGRPILIIPLSLPFRLLEQRANVIAILAVLTLGSGLLGERWVSHELFLLAIVVMAAILALPARYRLTTDGISPRRSSFRPWSDFQSWEARGNVVWLGSTTRFASLRLHVAAKEKDPLLNVLRQYVGVGAERLQRRGPVPQRMTKGREHGIRS